MGALQFAISEEGKLTKKREKGKREGKKIEESFQGSKQRKWDSVLDHSYSLGCFHGLASGFHLFSTNELGRPDCPQIYGRPFFDHFLLK